jgi:methyl-accepting chemotaxis protein
MKHKERAEQHYFEGADMRLFTDVRIGRRLAVGFGITLCLMIVIVITGIVYFNLTDRTLERMVMVNTAKIKNANDARAAFADITYLVARIITAEDGPGREEAKKRIDERRSTYKKSAEALESLEINHEGKELIAKLKEEVGKGRALNNSVIELAMAGNTETAAQKYGEVTKTAEGYIQAADNIIHYNEGRLQYRYEEAKKRCVTARAVFLVLGIVTLLIGALFSRATTRSIAIPITRSSDHIDLMAKGDFSIPVSPHALKRKDEMGTFARSMDAMNSNLSNILKEVTSSAMNVASASTQLNTSAERLSMGAMDQVERATQVATAHTEMNQASEDIARSSSQVAASANEAVEVAEGGREVVDKAIQEVNAIAKTVETTLRFVAELGTQTETIGDIVTVINDIADQTNLLALNAAIEAARAGEHGRGFAVVADEVRKLAERTASSTTEIGEMISTISKGVGKTIQSMETAKDKVVTGVEYSSQAHAALNRIITSIDTLHGGVHRTATAIEEMSATTNEIAKDINQISDVTKKNFSAAEEISGAASGLSDLAKHLESAVQNFKV